MLLIGPTDGPKILGATVAYPELVEGGVSKSRKFKCVGEGAVIG